MSEYIIRTRWDVLIEVHEQKAIYKTCSRILEEFPKGSRHKAAKKLNKDMDKALRAIEELSKIYNTYQEERPQ